MSGTGVQCTAASAVPVVCDISGDWCDRSYVAMIGFHGWVTGTVNCVRLKHMILANE